MAPRKKDEDLKKFERQKELARERQRCRRSKFTPEQWEEKRAKERQRYANLKKEKKIKSVKDLTPREHRVLKKKWRESKRRTRDKKRIEEEVVNNTPPRSDEEDQIQESLQKKRGRRQVRKDRSKAYRKIKEQEKCIIKLQRKIEMYKKRLQRSKKVTNQDVSPSPKKLVSNLLRGENVSPKVKKQLFLGFSLEKQIRSQTKETKGKKRQLIIKAVGNKILKKWRVQTHFQKLVPYKYNHILKNDQDLKNIIYERRIKKCISYKTRNILLNFYQDDSVSKICPGKKDVVVRNKIKNSAVF